MTQVILNGSGTRIRNGRKDAQLPGGLDLLELINAPFRCEVEEVKITVSAKCVRS